MACADSVRPSSLWLTHMCTARSHRVCHVPTRALVWPRLQPEPCEDCLTMCCCLPCAVAQHTLEIEDGFPEDGASLTAGGQMEMTGTNYDPPATRTGAAAPVSYA